MRNRQIGAPDNAIAEQDNVDIQCARTFWLSPKPAPAPLDIKAGLHERFGFEIGLDLDNGIQEPGLIGDLFRFRRVEGSTPDQPNTVAVQPAEG